MTKESILRERAHLKTVLASIHSQATAHTRRGGVVTLTDAAQLARELDAIAELAATQKEERDGK